MRATWARVRGVGFVAGTYVFAGLEAISMPGVLALERWRHRHWERRERGVASFLNAHETSKFSQFGEDGMLQALYNRIGTLDESFVELGAGDGHENTTRNLAEAGWSGAWIDADHPTEQAARIADGLSVTAELATVTPESAPEILEPAGVPVEFDLLAIDLDGIDYYVWRSIGRRYHPRVVVIEYNASAPPGVRWVQRYRPGRFWNGSRRFGASLDALVELAATLGYSLVGCESHGVNAFFVRDDVVADRLPGIEKSASTLYRSPKYRGDHFGHPSRHDRSDVYRYEPRG